MIKIKIYSPTPPVFKIYNVENLNVSSSFRFHFHLSIETSVKPTTLKLETLTTFIVMQAILFILYSLRNVVYTHTQIWQVSRYSLILFSISTDSPL